MEVESQVVKLISWVIGSISVALVGVLSFMFKNLYARVKDNEEGLKRHSKSITRLEGASVTKESVREIVKDELEPVIDSVRRTEKSAASIARNVERLQIETAVLKDRNNRES